jgi:hypothetical protein
VDTKRRARGTSYAWLATYATTFRTPDLATGDQQKASWRTVVFSRTEVPFLARFVEEVPARPPQKRPWPRETKDLSIFAAWKFAEQGKRTLIFVTQANWVEGFGNVARELVERGYLGSLLDDPEAIERAVEVGREWLGDDHCAVKCLQIGVAIHHGGLPNPFLRELELLLSQGAIKVTVASPTLHQP